MQALASTYGWAMQSGVSVWDCSNPLNLMLLFLCVYSLIVNYCFGHPTFWRKSSYNHLHLLSGQPNNISNVGRKKHATRVLEKLNTDLLHRVLGYFDPYELTVIRQVSRKYNAEAQSSKLWDDLSTCITEYKGYKVRDFQPVGNNCPMVRYFLGLEQTMQMLLRDESKLIIKIHNKLYDLSQFAVEHPGGGEILSEYKGKDATKVFDLASHSAFARQIGENMLLFDPVVYKGASGVPCVVKKVIVKVTR